MTKRQFLKMIVGLSALLPALGKSWARDYPPNITTTPMSANDTHVAALSPSDTGAGLIKPTRAIGDISGQDTLALRGPPPEPASHKTRNHILIQHSPIAGFQYYAGEQIWPQIKRHQALRLTREVDNKHDIRAVAVYWRQHKLGYLPRVENTAVAQLLDRGEPLTVRIAQLETSANPWKRMSVAVWLRV